MDTLINQYTISLTICLLSNPILGMEIEKNNNENSCITEQYCNMCKTDQGSEDKLLNHIVQCPALLRTAKMLHEKGAILTIPEYQEKPQPYAKDLSSSLLVQEKMNAEKLLSDVRKKGRPAKNSCDECGEVLSKKDLEGHKAVAHPIFVSASEYRPEQQEGNCDGSDLNVVQNREKQRVNRVRTSLLEMRSSSEEIKKCPLCRFTTVWGWGHVAVHIRSEHNGKPYPCAKCEKDFSHQQDLKKHQIKEHDKRCELLSVAKGIKKKNSKKKGGSRQCFCDECRTIFKKSDLALHRTTEHNILDGKQALPPQFPYGRGLIFTRLRKKID